MINLRLSILLGLITMISFGCRKKTGKLPAGKALEIIHALIASNTFGMIWQIEDASQDLVEDMLQSNLCNQTLRDTVIIDHQDSILSIYANYDFHREYNISCGALFVPTSANF